MSSDEEREGDIPASVDHYQSSVELICLVVDSDPSR